jgi:hypothetical protein
MGHGRRKDQHRDPGDQEEVEDNTNYKTRQRDAGPEEIAGRSSHCANPKRRASGSNGTIAREGRKNPGTGR